MDERLRESISALMDDESNELELKRILSHADNEEVQTVWANYHEVRQVIQQDRESHFNIDISAGVAAAIRDEPLANDKPLSSNKAEETQNVGLASVGSEQNVLSDANKTSNFGGRAWLALAASVAFVFVFTLQGTNQHKNEGVTSIASNGQSDGSLVKVASYQEPKVNVEMTEEQARHFGQYLLRHAEHSVRGTQSGFMPLARVASINSVGI